MSIESRISQVLKQETDRLTAPQELDERVLGAVGPQLAALREKGNVRAGKRLFGWKKAAVFALVFAVLTGFAFGATKLYETEYNGIGVEVFSDSSLKLTRTSGDEVRQTLQAVKQQLNPGEYAMVYFDAFTKESSALLREMPGIGVHRPYVYNGYDAWQQLVQQETGGLSVPASLGDDYGFVSGAEGYAQDGYTTVEGIELLDKLKQEARQSGESIRWEKVANPTQVLEVYTTFYESDSGEKVYMTVEVLEPRMKLRMTSISNETDQLRVGDKEVYYMDSQHFLSATDRVKDFSWEAGTDEQPVIVHLASESLDVTKEQLLSLVRGMLE